MELGNVLKWSLNRSPEFGASKEALNLELQKSVSKKEEEVL